MPSTFMNITWNGKTERIEEPTLAAVMIALHRLGVKVAPEVIARLKAEQQAA